MIHPGCTCHVSQYDVITPDLSRKSRFWQYKFVGSKPEENADFYLKIQMVLSGQLINGYCELWVVYFVVYMFKMFFFNVLQKRFSL